MVTVISLLSLCIIIRYSISHCNVIVLTSNVSYDDDFSAVAPPPSRVSLIPTANPPLEPSNRPPRRVKSPECAEDVLHDLVSIIADKFKNGNRLFTEYLFL